MAKEFIFEIKKKKGRKNAKKVEVKETDTLADLAYITLVSFKLFYGEFYSISYENKTFDSANKIYDDEKCQSAMSVVLKDLSLDSTKKLTLKYGSYNITEIMIQYVESRRISKTNNSKKEEHLDDNMITRMNAEWMKEEYESTSLMDILRITNDRMAFFYKLDINRIVNPFDYLRKYIPDNYSKLTSKEQDAVKIPDYQDLNIYLLPEYHELHHKHIMTSYVKQNVTNKEIRKILFYTLRNNNYLNKFYNTLRKYRLFKEYLEYSNDYYVKIINAWKIKNQINERKEKENEDNIQCNSRRLGKKN